MTLLRWAAGSLVLLYAVAVAALYLFQRALVYPIPQSGRTSPAAAGFSEAEEIVVPTRDGESIILWHVPPKANRPVVIFFHGNAEVLAWRVPRFRALTSDGTGLVALAFRGYAGSSGRPTEQGLMADAAAAYAFAATRYSPSQIVLWGYSLGSGVAVAQAATQPVGAVVLEAPYTSLVDVAARAFPLFPVRLLMRDRFSSDRRIGELKAPLLVLHGQRDTVIAPEFGRRLFARAPEPKRFVAFEAGTHVNLDELGAVAIAQRFLEETVGAQK